MSDTNGSKDRNSPGKRETETARARRLTEQLYLQERRRLHAAGKKLRQSEAR